MVKIGAKCIFVVVSLWFVVITTDCSADGPISTAEAKPALKFSKNTRFANIEVSLKYDSVDFPGDISSHSSDGHKQKVLTPEVTIFSTSRRDYLDYQIDDNNQLDIRKLNRSDRYKNTIPAVFRVTVKGYSIMEHSNNKTDTWTLNKMSGKAFRKPEIMFSLTKRF